MLKVTEKYYLGSNKATITLYERKVSETTGKESFKSVGYFNSLDALYAGLINREIKSDLELLMNIDKINSMIEELKSFTKTYLEEKKEV